MTCVCCYCDQSSFLNDVVIAKNNSIYRVARCARCNLMQVQPRPTSDFLENLYKTSYSGAVPNNRCRDRYETIVGRIRNLLRSQMGLDSGTNSRIITLLDVGCNLGGFLQAAKAWNFCCTGIDLSQKAVDYVNSQLIAVSYKLTVEEFCQHKGNGRFDVVTSFDVIEHVQNPRTFLDACCGLVRKGGFLVLGTPNVDSVFARLSFGTWYYADPPFHLNYFGRNLVHFVETRGFTLVRSEYSFAPNMLTRWLPCRSKLLQKGQTIPVDDFNDRASDNRSRLRRLLESGFDGFNRVTAPLRIGDTMVLYFTKRAS